MVLSLCFIAFILITCVLLNNASSKIGMPVLLAFLLLGIIIGSIEFIPIEFSDYETGEDICTVALIFIMFYGGFGTRWESAKSAAVPAGLLASIGVILTAGLTGLFCHWVLGWSWIESFLMGSVVSSTDAASVFSILRQRKLGLKNNSAPLLEIESGSNDPFSYMLIVLMLSLLEAKTSAGQIVWLVFKQLAFGAGFGVLIAWLSSLVLRRIQFNTSGFDSLFIFGIAIASYALPSLIGGNGYLSAYLVGIILGNSQLEGKRNLVHFFDGITGLMQVLVFFMLGLLARPALMHKVILPAIGIFIFMMLIARPLAVSSILTPFKKYNFKQQLLISFSGLRGASSIVFAIFAAMGATGLEHDIVNIVFCIVLLSIALQGYLLPKAAEKLDQIDKDADVMKTFNDFSEETDLQFSEIVITEDNPWKDMMIKDIVKPHNMLFCLVIRKNGTSAIPKGATILHEGDSVIMCTKAFRSEKKLKLVEHHITKKNKTVGKTIRECVTTDKVQVVLIRRKGENIIPNGNTIIQADDTLFLNLGR